MNDVFKKPILLERPFRRSSPWVYILAGALLGAIFEVVVCEPLDFALQNIFEFLYKGAPLRLGQALIPILRPLKWPGITLTGIIYGAVLGYVFYRLKEERQRIRTLHREFELQVATLRHHYKNLAVGISGFSGRVKRKLGDLDQQLTSCSQADCPAYVHSRGGFDTLKGNVEILEDASQRLSHTLSEELLFLKALTSESLTPGPRDIYPSLKHAVQDLLGLRFRDKEIQVEINGRHLEADQDPLIFPFEPYTMEVILQNILSNAMKHGDHIQVVAAEAGSWLRIEVHDNGPGLEVEKLKHHLLTPRDRKTESTHLGLEVTMHLLEKCGGRLSVWSEPGKGATFIIDMPK